MMMKKLFYLIIICGLFAKNAYAYLDPGSGSYIFQIIIAGIIGGLFAIKLFWKRIISGLKAFFKKKDDKLG